MDHQPPVTQSVGNVPTLIGGGSSEVQIKNEPRQFILLSNAIHQPVVSISSTSGATPTPGFATIAQLNNLSGVQAVPAQNVTVVAAPFGHSIHQPVNVSTGTPGTIHLAPFTQYISAQAPSNVATSGIGAPTPIYATLQSAPEFLPAGEFPPGTVVIQQYPSSNGTYSNVHQTQPPTVLATHSAVRPIKTDPISGRRGGSSTPKSVNIAGSYSSGSTTPTKTATLRQNLTVSKVTGTTPVSASTSNAGAGMSGSLTDHQQFKINFLDELGELALEINETAQKIEQAYGSSDSKLGAFAHSVATFTSLTHSALAELNAHVGNQASHINGILLRRGGTVPPFSTTLGTNEKIHFELNRCDHRHTLYDSERQSTVDIVELIEKFFVGKPKLQIPEVFSTAMTEYVLNSIYPVDTEKWTYCVRYSSRNGHRTVPHVLIEELKTQIAKGFGVYGTTAGSQVNLAIGAAVVNKATRFFNAKRRVSTRASMKTATKVVTSTSGSKLKSRQEEKSSLGSSTDGDQTNVVGTTGLVDEEPVNKILGFEHDLSLSNASDDPTLLDASIGNEGDGEESMEGIAGRQDGRGTQMLESLLLASGSSSSSTGTTGRALSNTSARNRRRTNRHCYQNDLQINGQPLLDDSGDSRPSI